MPKKPTSPPPQLTLFDLETFTAFDRVYDPVWNEPDSRTVLEQVILDTAPEHSNITKQLELTDTPHYSNPDSNVLEQESTDTKQLAPEQCHWVENYKVIRYHKEHYYYRYVWMSGRKLHHVHIPGGNVRSQLALFRKEKVEIAIASGLTPVEIEKLIRQPASSSSLSSEMTTFTQPDPASKPMMVNVSP